MTAQKTKSLESLEQKMENIDRNSVRYHVLESARDFKVSWIELGRSLYTVWKERLYKEWGYGEFDAYTVKEIGIRKQTAVKLLKSYSFLEKEEPAYLEKDYTESSSAGSIPSFESVDVLRQAKNKKVLDPEEYDNLKKDVFEKGKDARDLKKNLSVMIRQRQELDPEEAFQKRKETALRRLIGTLKALKMEIEIAKLLPAPLIKETAELIVKLEEELA